MPVNFGQRIAAAREKKGLSQRDLEKLSGVHFTTISRYENLDRNARVSIQELSRLATALEISVDELLGVNPPARDPVEARLDRIEGHLQSVDEHLQQHTELLGALLQAVREEGPGCCGYSEGKQGAA